MMEALRRSTAGDPPLHTAEVSRLALSNRIFAAVYTVALLFLFYHHITTLITFLPLAASKSLTSFFASFLLLAADAVLAFKWTTTQSFRMRPLYRTESPEILKNKVAEEDFPAIDVFICTADPYKEPPMVAVNTALSVMAYEYPPEKISIYVSDDGGSALTLFAFFEAAKFAARWLPFCRKNAVVDRSPEVFFAAYSSVTEQSLCPEAEEIKNLYENMKAKIKNVVKRGKVSDEYITDEDESRAFSKWMDGFTRQNHPTVIQVVMDKSKSRDLTGQVMPNLIYVTREKSESSIHHFKAGALNVLMRVSATMTNAPIILTLDCDTYSNDPQTPLRALCYFSDPKVQSDTAFVQFPQRFKGLNKNDIYGGEFKRLYVINAQGMDGLMGSCYVGSGCFFNRRALFGGPQNLILPELPELGPQNVVSKPIQSHKVMKLALAYHVARCNYENQTLWGYKIGVRYGSLSEDYNTGYQLTCEGWNTIFCNPKRAAFYGDSPSSLFDALSQNKRWALGLLMVAFSKYNPITYGVRFLGPLMALSYAYYAYWPTLCVPIIIYAFVPQLALLNGITLFPEVSEPWFILYLFLFFGAYGQDCLDFLVGGGTIQRWWNDQRMWLMRGLSSYLFGSVEYFSKTLGISSFGFNVTSKVNDEEQSQRYEKGVFEFGVHSPLFVLLTMAAIINFVALFWGLIMILRGQSAFEKISMQLLIALFAVINSRPVYEAFFVRSDRGGICTKTILVSTILVSPLFAIAFLTF